MVIKITDKLGEFSTFSEPENIEYAPDNRMELVKLVHGACVQDGWDGQKLDTADVVSFSATFDRDGFTRLRAISDSRERVAVEIRDERIVNALLVLKSYSYNVKFDGYKNASVEIWRAE